MTKQKTRREKIVTNKFLPLILMVLNLFFFFYLLPIRIAEEYTTLFAIVGGVISLILSFWIVGTSAPKLFEKAPIFMGIACISTLFIFGYFFIVQTTNFAVNQIRNHGVYTTAVITDKNILYGKRGRSTQSIDIEFITTENKHATANILVGKKTFQDLREGMKIPVVYSSQHTNIAEIDFKTLYPR